MSSLIALWEYVVDEFLISSTDGVGSLFFYDRTPSETKLPIEQFWVRVTDLNLSAACRVWEGYTAGHPARLFAEMASRWSGWPDEVTWESTEGEFKLRCSHDGLGHIAICVELQSGFMDDDWRVSATVFAEAGQLERIARQAALFFGQEF